MPIVGPKALHIVGPVSLSHVPLIILKISRQPSAVSSSAKSCSTQKADAVALLEVSWKQAGDTGVKSTRLEASRAYSGCRAVKRAPLLCLERSRGGLCKVLQAPPPHFLLSVRMCRRVCGGGQRQVASKRGARSNKQDEERAPISKSCRSDLQ